MSRERGFTLIELMISTVVIGSVVLVATGLAGSIRTTERFSTEYTGDLAGLRRAVRISFFVPGQDLLPAETDPVAAGETTIEEVVRVTAPAKSGGGTTPPARPASIPAG